MQINSVKAMNFKGNDETPVVKYENQTPIYTQEDMDKFESAVRKTKSDVNPVTVVATVLSTIAMAVSVKKAVPILRKAGLKVAEVASNVSTNLFGKIRNKIKPDSFDTTKTLENIQETFTRIRKNEGTVNEKMLGSLQKTVADVFGDDKAERTIAAMKKLGMTNATGIADAAVATGIAASIIDPVSDHVEDKADKAFLRRTIDGINAVANDRNIQQTAAQILSTIEG